MATKTISLELDAYERLRAANVGEKESFSSVVRRATFHATPHTGAAILEHLSALPPDGVAGATTFDYWERARREDRGQPRVSPSAWGDSDAP